MRVVFCSKYIPKTGDGASAYLLAMIDYLRQAGIEVEWICTNDSPSGGRTPWHVIGPRFYGLVHLSVWRNIQIGRLCVRPLPLYDWFYSVAALIARFIYRSIGRTHVLNRNNGSRVREKNVTRRSPLSSVQGTDFAARKLQANPPDALLANYIWAADVLDAAGPETLKLIITHDVQHERTASFKEFGLDSQIETWDAGTEARLLKKAQVLVAIQEEEAVSLKRLAPACEVITVPLPVVPQDCRTPQVPGRCLFVGSDQLHNVHGLYWFLGEVWPRILETVPQATLHVCGSICSVFSDSSSQFPNVRFVGRVTDVEPEYAAAEVCVVPSLVGSGLKIKLVEALSYGRACVTTRIGLQGLMELENKAVRLANTPELFAVAVGELLTRPETRHDMEQAARAFVADRLSPQAICQPLVDRIRQHAAMVQVARSRKETPPPTPWFHFKARAKKLLALTTPVGRLSYKMGHHLETGGLPDCGVPEPAGRFLFSIAGTTRGNGDIVEIGSCFGRSTIYLAKGARHADHGTVWAVDPHTGDIAWDLGRISTYEVFLRNIRKFGVENRVKPLKMTSKEAAQAWNGAPIRILFIDGWHSYEAVTEDILLWFPHVISGGLIVFDDYPNPEFPGVRQAVDEQMLKLPVERPIRIATTLAWTRKL
ncbi:MAG TPA: class I SAM-dependent methyltransferase [Verrucomicrobiae bacterium]|nr:class I SAM-dependent methyltransferase [Verrucomicrobiae bacterium]